MTARQAAQRTRWVVTSPLGTSGVWSSLGPADGPTLLVVGGHHGDEPAGYAAAGILSQYAQAEVGRLVVIPRANPSACEVFSRYSDSGGETDLNRCYRMPAGHRDAGCDTALHAAALLAAVTELRPDVVLDLHETSEHHSIARSRSEAGWCFADNETDRALAKAARVSVQHEDDPLRCTFTATMSDLGARSLAIETRVGVMLGQRVRAHLEIVRRVAEVVGVRCSLDHRALDARLGGS